MHDPNRLSALGPMAFAPELDAHTLLAQAANAPEELAEQIEGFASDLAEIRALPEAKHGPKREFPKLWDKPKGGLSDLFGLPTPAAGPKPVEGEEETT